jgi:hypothetical protein
MRCRTEQIVQIVILLKNPVANCDFTVLEVLRNVLSLDPHAPNAWKAPHSPLHHATKEDEILNYRNQLALG